MIRFLSSPLLTILIFLTMALYLLRGRYLGGSLGPEGMIVLASVLLLQGGWSFGERLLRLKQNRPLYSIKKVLKKGILFPGSLEEASDLLVKKGLSDSTVIHGDQKIRYLSRGERRSLVLETLGYGLLLCTLIVGIINYGVSIRGFITVSPGSEWVDAGQNLKRMRKGFFAERADMNFRIRATELTSATTEIPSQVSLEITDSAGGLIASYRLRAGEMVDFGRFRMQYRGDAYRAFVTVKKGEHDYMPAPMTLYKKSHSGMIRYHGKLYVTVKDSTGEGWYDPETKEFRVKLSEEGEIKFDRSFVFGQVIQERGFSVGITGLAHFGRLDVGRKDYKYLLFAGLVMLFVSVLVRLVVRPIRVYLWSEGGKTLFSTRSSVLRKVLEKG